MVKLNDALIGLVLLVIAGAVLIDIQGFPDIPGQHIGPGAFPGLLAILLAVCGVLLVAKGLRSRPGVAWCEFPAWTRSPRHVVNFLVVVASLLVCILLLDRLGFVLCSVIVLAVMFLSLGVRPKLILPVAVLVTLGVHSIFYFGLRVPLPWGVLQPVAW